LAGVTISAGHHHLSLLDRPRLRWQHLCWPPSPSPPTADSPTADSILYRRDNAVGAGDSQETVSFFQLF